MADARRPSDKRTAAEQRGRTGETYAALFLRLKGYRILAHRVRTPVGEVDLIAEKSGTVVFIEVKARKREATAIDAVSVHAWQRIARAAENWMAKRPQYSQHGWRYDLIGIVPGRLPIHLRDAWRPGMA
ncbi:MULTISPECIES: YraN family protein [Hyphomonas]|jgi:putative endonuclease|uniref:YraN family protein n=1 Tax=Hyphomonas TaxID=85 RepID=UPI0035139A25